MPVPKVINERRNILVHPKAADALKRAALDMNVTGYELASILMVACFGNNEQQEALNEALNEATISRITASLKALL